MIGIIIGLIISCLLVIYQLIPLKQQSRHDMLASLGGIGMIFSVLLAGMISGYIVENYFIKKYTQIGPKCGAIVGSMLIAPLSLYYGIIMGTIGGGIGSLFSSSFGLKAHGVYIGIFMAILISIIIIECIGAIIGSAIGSFIQNIVQKAY